MNNHLSEYIIQYLSTLEPYCEFENNIEWLHPYRNKKVMDIVETFFNDFYADQQMRTLIVGINPGRFGAGITGVPFTDPIALEEKCGIANKFERRAELSSIFVYKVIDAYGGSRKFYADFFISSVSPLGFIKGGKNFNYYDSGAVFRQLEPYLRKHMEWHFQHTISDHQIVNWGKGKNKKYLGKLYPDQRPYSGIKHLPHPRWVMQYNRKSLDKWIDAYVKTLSDAHRANLKKEKSHSQSLPNE